MRGAHALKDWPWFFAARHQTLKIPAFTFANLRYCSVSANKFVGFKKQLLSTDDRRGSTTGISRFFSISTSEKDTPCEAYAIRLKRLDGKRGRTRNDSRDQLVPLCRGLPDSFRSDRPQHLHEDVENDRDRLDPIELLRALRAAFLLGLAHASLLHNRAKFVRCCKNASGGERRVLFCRLRDPKRTCESGVSSPPP